MIGFIRIYKPELKYREYLVYNAYYCGICKALGDRYGLVYRNLINYDAVFIAILLDSIHGFEPGFEKFRCILHPTKRKHRCKSSDSTDYAADLTVFLTGAKFEDNIIDDNDFLSRAGRGVLSGGLKKSASRLGPLADRINGHLENLHAFEKNGHDNIDEVSGCYGNIIRDILARDTGGSDVAEEVCRIGYQMGKWIYLADAFSDLEKDISGNNYNPLVERFKYDGGDPDAFRDGIKERTAFLMYASLEDIAYTFEQIDKKINSGIIRNILYEGLFSLTENILNGDKDRDATEEPI